MPFIEKLGVNKVKEQIWQYQYVCTDPRIDGFVGFDCKQRLYEIKFAVDEALAKCPTYHGEEEWLEEKRTDKAFQKLGNR
jgi:hypothetical protein